MASIQQADKQDAPPSRTNWRSRVRAIMIGFGLVVAAVAIGTILSIPLILLGGTSLVALVGLIVISEASYAIAGWAYVRRWVSDVPRIKFPTQRGFGWTIASFLAMFGIATGIGVISSSTGIQIGRADEGLIAGSPTMVLVMVGLSLVLIAPAEEYLFRGVIQRRLTQSMKTNAAIVVTGILFILPHAVGYTGGVLNILLLSVAPFSLAIILGVLYEKFDNLSLPILAHGFYNATLFGITYFTTF